MGLFVSFCKDPVVRHPMRGKWPLLQSKTTQALPESSTLAPPGGEWHRFRLRAARHPLQEQLNRVEPLGLRSTDQKSLSLRVVPARLAGEASDGDILWMSQLWAAHPSPWSTELRSEILVYITIGLWHFLHLFMGELVKYIWSCRTYSKMFYGVLFPILFQLNHYRAQKLRLMLHLACFNTKD